MSFLDHRDGAVDLIFPWASWHPTGVKTQRRDSLEARP